MSTLAEAPSFNANSLRVEALEGGEPHGRRVPFRFEPRFNPTDRSYRSAGDIVFVAPDSRARRFAIYFDGVHEDSRPSEPTGDGDLLRVAGDGRTSLSAPASYPCVVDVDGDGRRDLVGSDRYGTGARVVWFRNIGTDAAPLFSERELYRLQDVDGRDISNPNSGWMLTTTFHDWDGDGKRDLLVGGWCRYLRFHKNVGTDRSPVFATGTTILDAKIFPGLDYGPNPDTPYQGVFIEVCDWDGDGAVDLLCGTYLRRHIYFLRNIGREKDGLPILAQPLALEAGGKPIDFLAHGKPSVGDWDGDGDLDLMAGQCYTESSPGPGEVAGCYYFENIGTRRNPSLATGQPLRDSLGQRLSAGFHSEPTLVDWNHDGMMDVVVTGREGIQLYLRDASTPDGKLVPTPIPFAGLDPCRVGGFAYPIAHDLDRDGTLDLIVADGDGFVRFFRGQESLQYAAPIGLKAGGEVIHEVGCPDGGEAHCGYAKVAIADWNGDGRSDLIMWTNNGLDGWQRGELRDGGWCLKFFAGTADPFDFAPAIAVKAGGRQIRAGYRCKPDVEDLDGDGLLDLVVACGQGKVSEECTLMFCRNVGTKTQWELAEPVPLTSDASRPLTTTVRTAVRFADWDGDGDLDLITGNQASMGVRYWENVGTTTRPRFRAPRPFATVNQVCQSHHEVGVDAVDLDRDGTLDLLVGNGDSGTIHFFRRAFVESEAKAELKAVERKEGSPKAKSVSPRER